MNQKAGTPSEEPRKARSIEEAAAAALEAAQAVAVPGGVELVFNSFDDDTPKGREYDLKTWLHAPAQLELLSFADRQLTKVSEQRGVPVHHVDWVRAARERGKKKVYLWPADEHDPDKIEVNRYDSAAWINLFSLLGRAKLTLPTGTRQLFDVVVVGPESPVGPALLIDLSKPKARRNEPVTNKQNAGNGASSKAKAQASKAKTEAKSTDGAGTKETESKPGE